MSKKIVINGKEYSDPNIIALANEYNTLENQLQDERELIRDHANKAFRKLKSEKRAELKTWGASDEWLHRFDEKIDTPQKLELAQSWFEEEKKNFPGYKYVGETPLDTLQKLYILEEKGDRKAHDLLDRMYQSLDGFEGGYTFYKCNACGKPITVSDNEERPEKCPHCGNDIQGV